MKPPGQASGASVGPRAGPHAGTVGPDWAGAEGSSRAGGKAAGPAGFYVHSGHHRAEPTAPTGLRGLTRAQGLRTSSGSQREAGDLKTGGSKGPEEGVDGGIEKSREQRQDLCQEGPGWTELLQGSVAWRPVGTWQVQG